MSDKKNKEKTITISEDEYKRLLQDSRFLDCLKNAGVDNWDWYEEAWKAYEERYPEEN